MWLVKCWHLVGRREAVCPHQRRSRRHSQITRCTVEKWGSAQCRAYIEQIEHAASEVATGRGVFKDMSSLLPGLRMKAAGRHYIFCVPQTSSPALILAVLHEKMDLIARLKNRLD